MADNELEAIFELDEEQEFDCLFTIDAITFDYEQLDKKPKINGETLEGDKSSADLHLASEQDLNDKYNELIRDLDDLTDVVEEDYNTLNTRITNVANDLQETIEENVVALQQEDTALQNQINIHSQTITGLDNRITNNSNAITQEIIDRENAINDITDELDTKQDILVSGQNIKTINNQSILGDGNIDIQGGGGASSFAELEGSPYDNEALANELNSLNIISLLLMYLRDSLGNNLLDKNGLTLIARR